MKYRTVIPYEKLKIRWSLAFYDHPLTGICTHFGEMHYFIWDYHEDIIKVFELTNKEKFKFRAAHLCFQILVGNHTTYVNGKRPGRYYTRKPAWLHKLGFKMFYSNWFQSVFLFFSVEVPSVEMNGTTSSRMLSRGQITS